MEVTEYKLQLENTLISTSVVCYTAVLSVVTQCSSPRLPWLTTAWRAGARINVITRRRTPVFTSSELHCFRVTSRSYCMHNASNSKFPKGDILNGVSDYCINLRWPTTVTTKPKTSRQNQRPYGKSKYTRQNQSYFAFAVKYLVLPWGFWFCREVFCFCREVFGFAVTVVGHHNK